MPKLLFVFDGYLKNANDWPVVQWYASRYEVALVGHPASQHLAYTAFAFRLRFLWRRIRLVWSVLRMGRKFDVALFQMPPPGVLTALLVRILHLRFPGIVWLSLIDYDKKGFRALDRLIVHWALPAASKVTVTSEEARKELIETHGLWLSDMVHVLPDWLPEEKTTVPLSGQDVPYVFSGGRSLRDWPLLLDVAQRLREVRFVLIVSSDDKVACSLDWPSNVQLLFDTPWWQFRSWMDRAQLVVVALRDPKAAVGVLTVLQALMLGKAVVATRTGVTAEYVADGENGLLVSPGDPDTLAEKIQWLLEHNSERQRMEACAAQSGQQYGVEAYCLGLQGILNDLWARENTSRQNCE